MIFNMNVILEHKILEKNKRTFVAFVYVYKILQITGCQGVEESGSEWMILRQWNMKKIYIVELLGKSK